ncbi:MULTISPECIES: dihydrodipicolinate synthase family protein [unclassified Pseudomonas]|jgi:4-hydroxy-tetrahydrodipicolinate synthase|uniref:dihydrodipicolinate synthase family protein n=1 Tax=unclassified Pseudomonas TaxID=196821 RepID=UPI00131ECF74|nr:MULTISPECIES: dihydrodipicolinate synthase family protein [unclassified Pseudomonas]
MSVTHPALRGVTVATVLPFTDDLAIDWTSYSRLLEYCATPEDVSAIFVNGHAGEGATLSPAERIEVIKRTRTFIGDSTPLLTGLIAFSTNDAVEQAKEAEQNGVDVAVIFPMPQFAAGAATDPRYVLDLVDEVLNATSLPVSIFQQSLASGSGFSTAVLVELAERDRVIAIKEGSGDIGVYEDNWRTLKALRPDIAILASNYHWMFAQMATGADGILSGMGSMIPQLLCSLWQASEAGDLAAMRQINDRLYPLVRTIYGAPPLIDMHTRLKVGLQHMGVIASARPRKPLLDIRPDVAQRIIQAVDAAGLRCN